MTRSIALVVALGAAAACASGEVERAGGQPREEDAPRRMRALPGPSQAICEPKHCPIFCLRIQGCVAEAECVAECQAVCGDGYFDDRDGPVMACVAGASGDACVAMRGCCETDFTSQICRALGTSTPITPIERSRIDEGARIGDKPGP